MGWKRRCFLALALAFAGCAPIDEAKDAPFSCRGVSCGMPGPALTLHLFDAIDDGGVRDPSVRDGGQCQSLCTADAGPCSRSICELFLREQPRVDGGFQFDVDIEAPGYRSKHHTEIVPASNNGPNVCCDIPFVPTTITVRLERE